MTIRVLPWLQGYSTLSDKQTIFSFPWAPPETMFCRGLKLPLPTLVARGPRWGLATRPPSLIRRLFKTWIGALLCKWLLSLIERYLLYVGNLA